MIPGHRGRELPPNPSQRSLCWGARSYHLLSVTADPRQHPTTSERAVLSLGDTQQGRPGCCLRAFEKMLPYQQERFLSVPPSTACSPQRPHVHLQPLPAGPSHLAQHPKVQGRSTWELFQDPQTQRGCVDARQRITHTSWEALRSPDTTETFCRVGFMTNKIFMSALRSLANWQVFIGVCTDIGRAHTVTAWKLTVTARRLNTSASHPPD